MSKDLGNLSGSARRNTGEIDNGSCDLHIIEIRAPISWVIALCAIEVNICNIYIYMLDICLCTQNTRQSKTE